MQDRQTRGQTLPARCVPTRLLSIPRSPRRDGSQCSFTKIGIISRNHSQLGSVPEKELDPMAFKGTPSTQLLTFCRTTLGVDPHGHLLQEVLLVMHRGKGTG